MEFTYCNLSFYNKEELLSKLDIDLQCSNEELLIKAYQIWGEKLLDEINGDFAFALYNSKKDEFFAARDPLGIKALYYVVVDDYYFFSDNIDELFERSGIDKKPNLRSIRKLLNQRAVEYEETMYDGVRRIPPAHYLKVYQGKVTLIRYWYPEKISINNSISMKEAAVKFNELFEKAIFSRIGNDEETAYELSGGLDSSSIVSVIKTKYPEKNTDTYSMCFDRMKCDEYPYIKSIEKKFNFFTSRINLGEIDYNKKYDFNYNYLMSPHWPVMLTFTMYFPMIEKMKKDNKKIIITGQGGDHLLSGNCYVLADLMERKEFGKALNELRQTLYISGNYLHCAAQALLTRGQKDFIKKMLLPFRKRKRSDESEAISDLFHLREIQSASKRADINFLLSASQSTVMDGNALHVLESAYDIEFRHPFFDKDLVEFVLSLPSEYKHSKGWIKVLLRISMDNILPEKIRSRSNKAEFSEVIVQQLQAEDVRKIMHKSYLVSLGLIEQKQIDKLILSFEKENYSKVSVLWTIVNLEYWYRHVKSYGGTV